MVCYRCYYCLAREREQSIIVGDANLDLWNVLRWNSTESLVKRAAHDVFLASFVLRHCLLAPTLQLQPSSSIVLQNDHLTILRVGQHLELFNCVPKVSCQQDSNRNAMCNKNIVSAFIQVETSPERVKKGGDTIKHITGTLAMRETIKEGSKSIAFLFELLDCFRVLGQARAIGVRHIHNCHRQPPAYRTRHSPDSYQNPVLEFWDLRAMSSPAPKVVRTTPLAAYRGQQCV